MQQKHEGAGVEQRRPHVVVIGGGFGGLAVARSLSKEDLHLTLIDRRNFHLFQPLLYQVATGGLSPANISVPLRALFKKRKNVEVLLGTVIDVDVAASAVIIEGGTSCPYDFLVVAAGSSHNYFGHAEWASFAPGLKTVEDALDIRKKVLLAFERAELEPDPTRQQDLMRFVVVGGGPTGVELAGALGEIAHQTLRGNFRHIDPAKAQILLLEGAPSILNGYVPVLVDKAREALQRLGVTVRESTLVKNVSKEGVTVECNGKREEIVSSCVVWAAGVQASPLGQILARQTGAILDRSGRIQVGKDLSIPNHSNVFVVGDLALIVQDGAPVPGVAPAAQQTGEYVAEVIRARIQSREGDLAPFRYSDKGAMATVGRSFAVAQIRRFRFWGFGAWIMWLWVHIFYLTQFANRLLVVIQWGWSYFTRNRSARIITGSSME
jgi:NADH dehydrogenase